MVISGLRNFWATELAGSVLDREANGEGLARLLARFADLEDFSKLNRMIRAASISHTRRPFHFGGKQVACLNEMDSLAVSFTFPLNKKLQLWLIEVV